MPKMNKMADHLLIKEMLVPKILSKSEFNEITRVMGEYDRTRNYVGAEGSLHHRVLGGILRTVLGIDINPFGWVHDGKYILGKTEQEKVVADAVGYLAGCECIKQTDIKFFRRTRKRAAYNRMSVYLHTLLLKGGEAYWKGKKK